MQKFTLLAILSLLFYGVQAQIQLPANSPSATVSQSVGLTKVTIDYSRPSMKGRKIFGTLVPLGQVWRTGANRITTIKFDDEVMLNGQKVAAGKYALATIPESKSWTIILNSDAEQWGTYSYDPKKDVLRFTVPVENTKMPVEHFTIEFDRFKPTQTDVVLSWEKTKVRFTVVQDPHDRIMAKIKEETAKPDAKGDVFFTAAEYYRDKNIDLKQALAWASKALESDKGYWVYQLRASIEAKLGMCKEATEDAKMCIEGAKKDKDTSYVRMGEKIVRECGK